jgi:hypothetical protein
LSSRYQVVFTGFDNFYISVLIDLLRLELLHLPGIILYQFSKAALKNGTEASIKAPPSFRFSNRMNRKIKMGNVMMINTYHQTGYICTCVFSYTQFKQRLYIIK